MATSTRKCLIAIALAFLQSASAFYLPGTAPTDYNTNDTVPLYVNRLTPQQSTKDPSLHSVVTYGYYNPNFGFCQPTEGVKDAGHESLGAVLFGDRIRNSPFQLRMLIGEECKEICAPKTLSARQAAFTNKRIEQSYSMNWLIDGLPAGQKYRIGGEDGPIMYSRGFPLGEMTENNQPAFYNHYDIEIDYHTTSSGKHRVVGVTVQPVSRAVKCAFETYSPLILNGAADNQVTFTYSVHWVESKVAWAVRWDTYLHVEDPKIHWFSLVNSSLIVVFLAGTVSTILLRALKKDFARYNRLETFSLDDFSGNGMTEDGIQEDSGWKLIHGDVFRPPLNPLLLSTLLGNGAQLFFMTGITIVFALLGFLSPSNRGSLSTVALLSYTLLSFVGGYVSAKVYKGFGGEKWKLNFIYTPLLVPGTVFGTFFLLNLFLWARGSSGAVPFTTMVVLVGIWFLISLPLSFLGSWIAFKQPAFEPPVKTNQIPRQMPPLPSSLRPFPALFVVGAFPFVAIFVELYFILNSLWFDRVYYMFGFLFLCYGLMVVTSACVTVMFVYYLLCAEHYRWQWRAFNAAGAGALYVFLFALIYWMWKIRFAGFTSVVLFVGYSALTSLLFFVLTGTIGFFASYAFVHRIFKSIRID